MSDLNALYELLLAKTRTKTRRAGSREVVPAPASTRGADTVASRRGKRKPLKPKPKHPPRVTEMTLWVTDTAGGTVYALTGRGRPVESYSYFAVLAECERRLSDVERLELALWPGLDALGIVVRRNHELERERDEVDRQIDRLDTGATWMRRMPQEVAA